LPANFVPTLLTLTYAQPVNNSSNVIVASVNINLVAVSANVVIDANSFVQNLLTRGYWNGLSFIPGRQITLITAS
jgi:hypothetical protein